MRDDLFFHCCCLRSSMLQLYSNPADYAWGQGGFDAVITEVSLGLLNDGAHVCLCTSTLGFFS